MTDPYAEQNLRDVLHDLREAQAEIERLRAALREIADLPIDEIGEPSAIARAALEDK